ncbi:hypothetical protein AAG906_004786 [Vitis piasezkii]
MFFSLNRVLFEESPGVRKMILNRPNKLNSLSYEMGQGKVFCSGGDVVAVVLSIYGGHWSFGESFYRKQITLDYLFATSEKTLVSLINGIVMGGGVGLSMNSRFRVVTENTVFAMPEVQMGHFPDVGVSYFLSRLPGFFGEYLGLTGAQLNGTEMLACGLATHFVLSKDLLLLETALSEAASDTSTIAKVINRFARKTFPKQDSAFMRLEIINKCFSAKTVEEILLLLQNEVANGSDAWIIKAISSMKSASPTSLKITLRSIREARMQELEDCLVRDHFIGYHIIQGIHSIDFLEGSRTKLFEKGKKPKWEPSKLELVSDEMVDHYFAKVEAPDFEHLRLPARKKIPKALESKL